MTDHDDGIDAIRYVIDPAGDHAKPEKIKIYIKTPWITKYKKEKKMTQNLKIKIKEVVEERREISIGDEAMIFLVEELKTESFPRFGFQLQTGCAMALDKNGYVRCSAKLEQYPHTAMFRRETIRDATPEEIRAYHIIKLSKVGWIYLPISGWRYDADVISNMREILKGKEVIFEIEESE
jgi:hypothetical protein